MDRKEFERRRRALEELYQADLRLLRAAHEARVRSLEALWLALEGGDLALPPPSAILLPAGAPQIPEPVLPEPAAASALPPAPSRNPDVRLALEEILPELPTVFEKKDIGLALGWLPSRSSLNRVLLEMVYEGRLEFAFLSQGRTPSQYRKV